MTALLAAKMDFGTRANWNRFLEAMREFDDDDSTIENSLQNMAPMNTNNGYANRSVPTKIWKMNVYTAANSNGSRMAHPTPSPARR